MDNIFVRIPKNASRSIKYTGLFGYGNHETISQMLQRAKRNIFTFCVCRNPYDRLLSAYKNGKDFCSHKQFPYFVEFDKYNSFEEFCHDEKNPFLYKYVIQSNRNDIPAKRVQHIHFLSQSHWVVVDDKIMVNRVLQYEHLDVQWKQLLIDLDLDHVDLPKHNKSDHLNWTKYYTSRIANIVYNYYEEDFIRFGYNRDSWRRDGKSIQYA